MVLEVLAPGLHSTIQDAGRPGHGHLGVRRAGAADELAMAVANLLVGAPRDAAVVELTLLGGTFAVRADCLLGIAGADMDARVPEEGRALPPRRSHRLRAGTTLEFGGSLDGARTYLALAGGIEAQAVLGSCSTDPVAGFGGHDGQALREGDTLMAGASPDVPVGERAWPEGTAASGVVEGDAPREVDIVAGPHVAALGSALDHELAERTWTVTPRSDRAGLRLDGEPLPGVAPSDLVSLPMLPGAVQLPSGGLPIVLMPDAPTIGGYAVPAVVVAADRSILGQLRPGDGLRFRWVDGDTARDRWLALQAGLRAAADRLA
ncbi:biotin-dependent carboxyltransferase family protein [soil metagenome]